ncbi:hypothetical protein [Delftia sp. RIT313]|uniref:hypothetical protein n=1 Tax=Delftia sp. RIT313 TaxID=1468410 RepID=UPI001F31EDFD|nr:hypothetical protein [Delftia sp. RIT313]
MASVGRSHPKDDPERTTPIGMVRYGHEFLVSAFILYRNAAEADHRMVIPPVPAMYLLGHGLELTFKAYLLANDVSLAHLRQAVGHDLEKALLESRAQGLDSLVQWSACEEAALTLLNRLYRSKELEYIVTGTKLIPHYPWLQNFAVHTFDAVASMLGFRERLTSWSLSDPRAWQHPC